MSKRQPIHDINDYLLEKTRVGELLGYDPSILGSIKPIIPTQQQPEPNATNSLSPYIVYSFRTVGGTDHWWTRMDEASYVIWGSSFDTLSEIANEITEHLVALDESAGDIMAYLDSRAPIQYNWDFHYVRILSSFSPDPARQEAGRMGWIITIRYEYSPVNGKYLA